MKEIDVTSINQYVDIMSLRKNPAIAIANNGTQTNGLTIGWFSLGVLWHHYCATTYIHATRYSKQIFDGAEYYAVCIMEEKHKDVVSYFGRVSGRDENKIEKCGLKLNCDDVAPYFEESKAVILCRIMGKSDFDVNSVDDSVKQWYQKEGVHTQYYGDIVKVLVKE